MPEEEAMGLMGFPGPPLWKGQFMAPSSSTPDVGIRVAIVLFPRLPSEWQVFADSLPGSSYVTCNNGELLDLCPSKI